MESEVQISGLTSKVVDFESPLNADFSKIPKEFIKEIRNFKGFDYISEQENIMIKQMVLNKKIKKVKAELIREEVDDLKEVLGIDAETLLIEILNEELNAAAHKENIRLKRDKLKNKLNKIKNV